MVFNFIYPNRGHVQVFSYTRFITKYKYLSNSFIYLSINNIYCYWINEICSQSKEDELELTTVLANALDSRDSYTLNHSENVAKYSVQIAEKLKLSKECCAIIRKGALLHDIGKIGISDIY